MNKVYGPIFIVLFFLASIASCQKGAGGGGECSETAMTVTTSPAINSTEAAAPGTTFPLTVNITANLPNAGATVSIKARPESSTTAFLLKQKPLLRRSIISQLPVPQPEFLVW